MGKMRKSETTNTQGFSVDLSPFFPKKRRSKSLITIGLSATLFYSSILSGSSEEAKPFIPSRPSSSRSISDDRVTGQAAFSSPQIASLREENKRLTDEIRKLKEELVQTARQLRETKSQLFSSSGDPADRAKISELRLELANKEELNQQLIEIAKDLEQTLELRELQIATLEIEVKEQKELIALQSQGVRQSQSSLNIELQELSEALAAERAHTAELEQNRIALEKTFEAHNSKSSRFVDEVKDLYARIQELETQIDYQSDLYKLTQLQQQHDFAHLNQEKAELLSKLEKVTGDLITAQLQVAELSDVFKTSLNEERHYGAQLAKDKTNLTKTQTLNLGEIQELKREVAKLRDITSKQDDLEGLLSEAISLYEAKQEEVKGLQTELAAVSEKSEALNLLLKRKEDQIAQANRHFQDTELDHQKSYAALLEQIETLSQSLEETRTMTNGEHFHQYSDLIEQIELLTKSLEKSLDENESLTHQLASLSMESVESKESIDNLLNELNLSSQAIEVTSVELASAKQKLKETEASLEKLKTTFLTQDSDLTGEIVKLTEALSSERARSEKLETDLQDALVRYQQQCEESDALNLEFAQNKQQIELLESDLNLAQEAISESQKEINDLTSTYSDTYVEMQDYISSITDELSLKRAHAQDLQATLAQYEEENGALLLKSRSLEEELASALLHSSQLEETLANNVTQSDLHLEHVNYLAGKLHLASETVKDLENELSFQVEKCKAHESQKEELQKELALVTSKLYQERESRHMLDDNFANLGNVQLDYAELQKQLMDISQKASSLQAALKEEKELSKAKEEKLQALTRLNSSEKSELSKIIHEMQNSIHEDQARHQEILKERDELYARWESDHETLTEIARRFEEASKKLAFYESDFKSKEEQLQAQSNQLEKLKSTVVNLTSELKQEKDRAVQLTAQSTASQIELQEKIEDLSLSLNNELERVEKLKAFQKANKDKFLEKEQEALAQFQELSEGVDQLEIHLAEEQKLAQEILGQLSKVTLENEGQKELITQLEEQLSVHEGQIAQMTKNLELKEILLSNKSTEMDALVEEHYQTAEALERKVSILSNNLEQEMETCSLLKDQIAIATSDLEATQNQVQTLEKNYTQTTEQRNQLAEALQIKENRLATLERQAEGYDQRIEDLQQELTAHKKLLTNKNSEIQEIETQLSTGQHDFKDQITALASQLDQEKNLTTHLKNELDVTTSKYQTYFQQSSDLQEALSQAQSRALELEEYLISQQSQLEAQQAQLSTLNTAFNTNEYQLSNNVSHLETKLAQKEQEVLQLQNQLSLVLNDTQSKGKNVSQIESKLKEFEFKTDELSRQLSEHRRILSKKTDELRNLTATTQESERELCNQIIDLETRLEVEEQSVEESSQHLSEALDQLQKEKNAHAAARRERDKLEEELNLIAAHLEEGEAAQEELRQHLALLNSHTNAENEELLAAKEQELQTLAAAYQAATMELSSELRQLAAGLEKEKDHAQQLQRQKQDALAEATTQAELRLSYEARLAEATSLIASLNNENSLFQNELVSAQEHIVALNGAQDELQESLIQELNRNEELQHALVNAESSLSQKVAPEALEQLQNELRAALALASQREKALYMAEELAASAMSNHKDLVEQQKKIQWEKEELERSLQREIAKMNRQKEKTLEEYAKVGQGSRTQLNTQAERTKPIIAISPAVPRIPTTQTTAQAPSPTSVEEAEEVNHTVSKGETLRSISKKYYGTVTRWSDIYEANSKRITDKDCILAGMDLVIPE